MTKKLESGGREADRSRMTGQISNSELRYSVDRGEGGEGFINVVKTRHTHIVMRKLFFIWHPRSSPDPSSFLESVAFFIQDCDFFFVRHDLLFEVVLAKHEI